MHIKQVFESKIEQYIVSIVIAIRLPMCLRFVIAVRTWVPKNVKNNYTKLYANNYSMPYACREAHARHDVYRICGSVTHGGDYIGTRFQQFSSNYLFLTEC